MASSNCRTLEFKEAVQNRRKRTTESSRPLSKPRLTKPSPDKHPDTWTKEAQVLSNNIQDLLQFLTTIKRPYLDPSPSTSASGSTKPSERLVDIKRGFQGFSHVRWFSEKEKDEIDVLVGVGLKKCVQGVRALEAADQARKSQHAEQHSNTLSRLLRLPLHGGDASFEQFNSHRASILWFLNQRLTELSKIIKNQQELRAQKQIQQLSKGGLASMVGVQDLSRTTAGVQHQMLSTSDKGKIPSIFQPSRSNPWSEDPLEAQPIEKILSASQLQQFDSESSALLRTTENTLASIKQTESSLLEISNLQSELVFHLTQQTELIDTLWDDAVVSTGKVEQGNLQLLTAKENNRESRIWLLTFLLGASFALLFVDYIAP
ncbi:hypothetical protein CROQUDRAFT_656544 [Cronartium quercuum f. sp. fusiforme G11]|uniref:SNARE-complex protein Syntaxin-18 N-terminal domain-containing protein n=1 Tax=Cronartium quercuum f. sp. fusiforme G11 TaxID=708437 RepID=A0A9P6NMX4_9BASI|nr:hypothetical protein CROQUDRAFT_656544 [Cronartium quercuum f. sp. fusiforme G11]